MFRLGVSVEIDVWFMGIIEVFVSSMVGPLFQDQFPGEDVTAEKLKEDFSFQPCSDTMFTFKA